MDNSAPKLPTLGDYVAVVASAIVPMLVLIWGMHADNPYDYYVFLRIVVCLGAFVFWATFAGYGREPWVIVFVVITVLYNPFITVHLNRAIWFVFNVATILAFLSGLVLWIDIVRKARNSA